jgi:hypothetical protein
MNVGDWFFPDLLVTCQLISRRCRLQLFGMAVVFFTFVVIVGTSNPYHKLFGCFLEGQVARKFPECLSVTRRDADNIFMHLLPASST